MIDSLPVSRPSPLHPNRPLALARNRRISIHWSCFHVVLPSVLTRGSRSSRKSLSATQRCGCIVGFHIAADPASSGFSLRLEAGFLPQSPPQSFENDNFVIYEATSLCWRKFREKQRF